MSQGTSETVECPLCEEEFDPSAAGGWCTNSDCGEWQYEEATDAVDGGDGEGDASDEAPDEPADSAEESSEADEPAEPAEEAAEADESSESAEEAAEADESSESDVDEEDSEEELACPSCGDAVEPEDNFCANCGKDVSALEPGPLEECPSCAEPVEPEDNFCSNCGENLDEYRPETDGEDEREPERASVASSATGSEGDEAEERPVEESLKLVVRNHEIRVWDGDTVGRKVRGIVIETGGDEDDAVRIHREHIRFIREGDQFYVKALGQNPTRVNSDLLEQGERAPIEPGDRIELSGIAKIRVEEP